VRTYVVEVSVVSSYASSVARQPKEVELEKARRKASLDQERRRIEADERRVRAEAEQRRALEDAGIMNAELKDQQNILDLEADLEKDKILEGNSLDLDGIDPEDDEIERPSNAFHPPDRDKAGNPQEDHIEIG
jgi:hypothetical protein